MDSIGHTLLRAAVQLGSHNTGAFLWRRRPALVHYFQGLPCTCSRAALLTTADAPQNVGVPTLLAAESQPHLSWDPQRPSLLAQCPAPQC